MSRSTFVGRLVGLVAAVALSVGLGAVGAAPAEAAGNVWNKVAKCESGGHWKINTGNGYYGGLQFSRSTWKAFGGRKYAKNAHKASKGEQIAIARRTLARQGAGAWGSCGRKAKLTKRNGKASKTATPSTNPGAKKKHKKKSSKKNSAAQKTTSAETKYSGSTSGKTATVKPGDTLAKIAKRYDVQGGWKGLWQLNKAQVKNPDSIRVGQDLLIRN